MSAGYGAASEQLYWTSVTVLDSFLPKSVCVSNFFIPIFYVLAFLASGIFTVKQMEVSDSRNAL